MKNLNSSYTQSERIFEFKLIYKLNQILTVCEYCSYNIPYIILTQREARYLLRNTAVFLYYRHKFNKLGVELVCPRAKKEII